MSSEISSGSDSGIGSQWRKAWSKRTVLIAVIVVGVAILIVAGAVLAALLGDKDPADMFRDLAATTGANPFVGAVSSLGVAAWTIAASICLFSGVLLARSGRLAMARFLIWFGVLSAIAAADDYFMLHENLLERIHSSIQPLYVAVYVGLVIAFLITQRRQLLDENLILLIAAGGFLGLSIFVDLVGDAMDIKPAHITELEDGFKLLGILLWSTYGVVRAYRSLAAPRTVDQPA